MIRRPAPEVRVHSSGLVSRRVATTDGARIVSFRGCMSSASEESSVPALATSSTRRDTRVTRVQNDCCVGRGNLRGDQMCMALARRSEGGGEGCAVLAGYGELDTLGGARDCRGETPV